MYLLIAVWGSSSVFPTFARTKEYSAMKLTMMLVAASILIFLGIFAVFNEAGLGTFDLQTLYAVHSSMTNFQKMGLPAVRRSAAACLAGLWPFHTWSPDGHVSAPTAVSMLHAGVLMKLGAFGIIRLGIQLLPDGARSGCRDSMVLATINVVYGAFAAMAQTDFKYMIGYSSVSHMGLVLMGLATHEHHRRQRRRPADVLARRHDGAFFAMVGSVYDQAHTRDMTLFGGLVQQDAAVRRLLRRRRPRLRSVYRGCPASSPSSTSSSAPSSTYPWAGALGIFAAAHHGGLHPAHDGDGALRSVQRALGRRSRR